MGSQPGTLYPRERIRPMAIEQRGSSWRAKVFDGKTLVTQKTFKTKAEAIRFEKIEKAKIALGLEEMWRDANRKLLARLRFARVPELARLNEIARALPPEDVRHQP